MALTDRVDKAALDTHLWRAGGREADLDTFHAEPFGMLFAMAAQRSWHRVRDQIRDEVLADPSLLNEEDFARERRPAEGGQGPA